MIKRLIFQYDSSRKLYSAKTSYGVYSIRKHDLSSTHSVYVLTKHNCAEISTFEVFDRAVQSANEHHSDLILQEITIR
jgi:hypothetical protein